MKSRTILNKPTIHSMIFVLLLASFQMPAMADMIGNSDLAQQSERQLQIDEVKHSLARDDVRAALQQHGVDPADIETRLGNLTGAELTQIHAQFADLPAGGDALGIVFGVILIFVLLDLLGATDIFPRI